jgi:predicted DNA-binding protein with PD1-like motif
MRRTLLALCPAIILTATSAFAGEADVTAVAVRDAAGTYTFSVTVRHDDKGWEHFADNWEVVAMDGTVIATRTLFHPHVNEQPFTRSLGGVRVPAGTKEVRIRAHDKVHGNGGQELIVKMETGETRTVQEGQS